MTGRLVVEHHAETIVISVGYHKKALRGAKWSFVSFVFPICHVVVNVLGDAVQFRGVADNMVVKPGLPDKGDVFLMGEFRHGGFEIADGAGQSVFPA